MGCTSEEAVATTQNNLKLGCREFLCVTRRVQKDCSVSATAYSKAKREEKQRATMKKKCIKRMG